MGYGDEILAAGQAQRLYNRSGERVEILDLNGQRRWHPIWEGNPVIVRPGDDVGCYQSITSAPNARPYIVYPFTVDTGWHFNRDFRARDHRARIYLTDAERQCGLGTLAERGPYLLVEPYTKHENLRWPLALWKLLTRALHRVCPDYAIVQHTHRDTVEVLPGAQAVHATFREACGLVASCACYIRSESGMCHAAAALGAYQVTIWGGCMDWEVLGGYPHQAGLIDTGPQSPCGSWKRCLHCQQILTQIRVEMVVTAVQRQLEIRALESMVPA